MKNVKKFKEGWAIELKKEKLREGAEIIGYFENGQCIGALKKYEKGGIIISIGINHWDCYDSFKILLNSINFCSNFLKIWSPSFHFSFPLSKRIVAEAFLKTISIKMKRKQNHGLVIPRVMIYLIIEHFMKLKNL